MSSLSTTNKVSMFLSSYIPLFIILLLKAFSSVWDKSQEFAKLKVSDATFANMTVIDKLQTVNQYKTEFIFSIIVPLFVIIIIIAVIKLSYFKLMKIMKETENTKNPKSLSIESVQKMDHVYIEYLICYVIPFLFFNFSSIVDMTALFIFLATACIIYINSDLLYVNIIFSIKGYNLFKVRAENKYEYVILSKKKQLYVDEIIKVRDVSSSSERFVLDLV